MEPELTYRYAAPGDAAALRALIERAYRGPAAAQGWTSEADLLTGPRTRPGEVEELIADPKARFVLAGRGGLPLANALLKREWRGAYFGMFAVEPAVQGGGLGGALLAECERRARALWAAPELWMAVISLRRDLIAWYERHGYVETGEAIPFPFADWMGATRRDFHLAVLRKPLA